MASNVSLFFPLVYINITYTISYAYIIYIKNQDAFPTR